ncbi:hypothetical protein HOY82DRAFT_536665 [Tuber indicum]|nr:hypothetical protein HOY82DRAFT_536665 [Tuber indicum]
MPSRRGNRRAGGQASSSQRGNTAGIRRNARNHHAPLRYGQVPEPPRTPGIPEVSEESGSNSNAEEPSEYTQSLPSSIQLNHPSEPRQSDIVTSSPISQQSTHTQNSEPGSPTQNEPISLEDIRHLL